MGIGFLVSHLFPLYLLRLTPPDQMSVETDVLLTFIVVQPVTSPPRFIVVLETNPRWSQ